MRKPAGWLKGRGARARRAGRALKGRRSKGQGRRAQHARSLPATTTSSRTD